MMKKMTLMMKTVTASGKQENNMNAILVKSSGDWGDEFDLEGFALFPSEESYQMYLDNIPDEFVERYFGSNEFVTFEGKDDYLSYLTAVPITSQETLRILLETFFNKGVDEFFAGGRRLEYGLFISNQSN